PSGVCFIAPSQPRIHGGSVPRVRGLTRGPRDGRAPDGAMEPTPEGVAANAARRRFCDLAFTPACVNRSQRWPSPPSGGFFFSPSPPPAHGGGVPPVRGAP